MNVYHHHFISNIFCCDKVKKDDSEHSKDLLNGKNTITKQKRVLKMQCNI
jgi:hypothetical protein